MLGTIRRVIATTANYQRRSWRCLEADWYAPIPPYPLYPFEFILPCFSLPANLQSLLSGDEAEREQKKKSLSTMSTIVAVCCTIFTSFTCSHNLLTWPPTAPLTRSVCSWSNWRFCCLLVLFSHRTTRDGFIVNSTCTIHYLYTLAIRIGSQPMDGRFAVDRRIYYGLISVQALLAYMFFKSLLLTYTNSRAFYDQHIVQSFPWYSKKLFSLCALCCWMS